MNFLLIIFFSIIFSSCSSSQNQIKDGFKEKNIYVFNDSTGEYFLERDILIKNKKLITRQKIYSSMEPDKLLEKSIMISSLGKLKVGSNLINYTRPDISQFTIWFEKQKFFSQLKTLKKNKSLEIVMLSPEEKWNGNKEIKYPKGATFCYYTQIPDCLKIQGHLNSLINKEKKQIPFYLIWESYPYQGEQLNNISDSPFQKAVILYEGINNGLHRFIVDLGNQTILYHYNLDLKFEMMFWVAQGITLKKQEFGE